MKYIKGILATAVGLPILAVALVILLGILAWQIGMELMVDPQLSERDDDKRDSIWAGE